MKAFLLAGSPNEASHTLALTRAIARSLESLGHETVVWDIAEKPLPPFKVIFHSDPAKVTGIGRDFLRQLDESSMVVIGTPLYHGSYSGALKNALDYLLKDQLEDKPVGLVCNGGVSKAMQAIGHLVQITQTLYGVPMQTQIATTGSDFIESTDGYELDSSATEERIHRLTSELDRYCTLLRS